ncbi:MAG TPA: hypothetical protein VEY88_18455 [Archangium sp.]|nr:hypothetical protein [Archangium sp.]
MEPVASITFDDSLWPLLVVKFVGAPTNQQQEAYLSQLRDYLRHGERYVSILDTRLLRMMSSEQRVRQAEFIKENEGLLRQVTLGMAAIVTSPLIRLAASVFLHLKPMPTPYYCAPTLPAAADWTADRLTQAGLGVSAERVRRHFGLLVERRAG